MDSIVACSRPALILARSFRIFSLEMQETTVIRSAPYSTDAAFEYCERLTKSHYENFPVASLFIPEAKRPYLQTLYAFSRMADDMADEQAYTEDERMGKLAAWGEMLERCYAGEADHPVFVALRETVARTRIPIEPLRDLLTAFRRDVVQKRYETFEDLLSYCRCSANPVGRMVLMIFDHRADELFSLSDNICTALQLANFWQDLAVDARKDRCYLPLEDMRRFGVTVEDWNSGRMSEGFRKLMKFEVERTRDLFYAGAALPSLVEKELQVELRLVWFGGMAILRKIERVGFDVYHSRPSIAAGSKALVLYRALAVSDLTKFGRKKKAWDLT